MVVFKQYNDTYWSLTHLNPEIYKKGKKGKKCEKPDWLKDKEEVERISLCRTKRRIKEICLCNDFDYFVTMTVSSKIKEYNRFDLENCVDNCKKFMHKLKRKSNKFKFIFIIEEHDKGGYHFHGMMKGVPIDDIYKNKNGYLSSHTLDGLGFNSFSKIDDYNKCCNYITKYVTKNCLRTENNQIYFCSRGLDKPYEEVMIPIDLKTIFVDVYENKYCQIKDFDLRKLSQKEKLLLHKYFCESDEFLQNDNNYFTNWLKLFTDLYNKGKIKIQK